MNPETATREEFHTYLTSLDDAYHNDQAIVSDAAYDTLREQYIEKFGKYDAVGAPTRGDKVALPYLLPSLDKLKEEKQLSKFCLNYHGPYLCEDKIDGLTLLYLWSVSSGGFLFTRGQGTNGEDVSHHLPYLKLPRPEFDIAVRGEIVIPNKVFQEHRDVYMNARNMTSGVLRAKESFDAKISSQLCFYAYQLMNAPQDMTHSQEREYLQGLGFTIPHASSADELTVPQLREIYEHRASQAEYEMDGLVVISSVPRGERPPVLENPKHMIAYKPPTETAVVTVVSVQWTASRQRKMKPVVLYEPITLSGAVLRQATAHNARYVVEHNIGPGAVIEVVRSGSTIPYIIRVISPSEASLPPLDTVEWNQNHVELLVRGTTRDVIVGIILHFLETLEIKNFGRERVCRLVESGVSSLDEFLALTPERIRAIDGFDAIADTFLDDLRQRLSSVTLAKIADASGMFPGIGPKRWSAIIASFPHILSWPEIYDEDTMGSMTMQIHGFDTLSYTVASHLTEFVEWLRRHPEISLVTEDKHDSVTSEFSNRVFAFSGVRDADLSRKLRSMGARVEEGVTKQTTDLIYDKIGTTKYEKALRYKAQVHEYVRFKNSL